MKPNTKSPPPIYHKESSRNPVILYLLSRLIVQSVKYSINQTAFIRLIGREFSYDELHQALIRCSKILFN